MANLNVSGKVTVGGDLTIGGGAEVDGIERKSLTTTMSYIKFKSGVLIYWFSMTSVIADYKSKQITFDTNAKFVDTNYAVTLGSYYPSDDGTWQNTMSVSSKLTTSVTIYCRGSKNGGRIPYMIAIGRWK